jgi:sugar/nucleoside kinase (ribokinase family)
MARPILDGTAGGDSTRRVCQDRVVRVVTLGDLLLDVVVRLEAPPATDDDVPAAIALAPGGQAANVAAWARWLGAEARLIARRADDAAGRLIASELEGRGVELAGPVLAGERTGTVVALVAPGGARTLASDRGAAGELGPGDVGDAMVEGADVFHVAGYTLMRAPGAEAALRLAGAARRYGARVTVDLSTAHGIAALGRDEMRRRVAALAPDVVFANEAEADAFGAPLDGVWVTKRGALGCVVELGGETLVFSAIALDGIQADGAQRTGVVDTTGAGDAFAAGYLLGGEPEAAVQRALGAAARCVTRVGALP